MKRYLTLEDGTTFVGEGFGAAADAVGELVFTTGMSRRSLIRAMRGRS